MAKSAKAAGRGATITATFALGEADEIRIIVGQKGSIYTGKDYYGGSGGTFVVKYRVRLLIIKLCWFFSKFQNVLQKSASSQM